MAVRAQVGRLLLYCFPRSLENEASVERRKAVSVTERNSCAGDPVRILGRVCWRTWSVKVALHYIGFRPPEPVRLSARNTNA